MTWTRLQLSIFFKISKRRPFAKRTTSTSNAVNHSSVKVLAQLEGFSFAIFRWDKASHDNWSHMTSEFGFEWLSVLERLVLATSQPDRCSSHMKQAKHLCRASKLQLQHSVFCRALLLSPSSERYRLSVYSNRRLSPRGPGGNAHPHASNVAHPKARFTTP